MERCLIIWLLSVAALFSACSTDNYDTGDGVLSSMRADFVEAETDVSAAVAGVVTDDGEHFMLTRRVKAEWIEKPDTAYRALLYYNKVASSDGATMAEPVALLRVFTPEIKFAGDFKDGIKTDPVTFVSSWMSANRRFINLDLKVRTSMNNAAEKGHTIGMICDNVEQKTDGCRRINLRLYHDRNDIPEYYSVPLYVSVPLTFLPVTPSAGDEVVVRIAGYEGEVVKTFVF